MGQQEVGNQPRALKDRGRHASLISSTAALLALVLVLALGGTAAAHGANISYTSTVGVALAAAYDSGEPMAEAQVMIYAPNDLSTPWQTGTTDENGHYFFTPDPELPGTWDVQVRQAGHGQIIHIPLGEGAMPTSGGGGFSTMQIILMSACVIWGLAGTALYFSGRKS
ncbi:MAG: carboxypeptidase-like regulatory domain-containing protein [Candidatus Promineifilaceae bacterium]